MRQAPPRRPAVIPFFLLLVLCLFAGLIAGLTTFHWASNGGGKSFLPGLIDPRAQFGGKNRINVLVMGIDDNWTNRDMVYTRGARTDTIFVVSLDLAHSKGYLLSIPRDSRVPIAGTRHWGKINGAYATGGVQRALQTVSNFLDIPIDDYVVLKIDATKNLVDAIGGVDLNVEKDMKYNDNWGHLHINLKKGFQHLDGEQAVGYIRFRHDIEGDFGRMRRQQQLLHVIAEKLKSPMMYPHLPELARSFRQSVDTNLQDNQIAALASLFRSTSPSQIVSSYIPAANQRIGGVWYLIPDQDRKELLVDWLLKGDTSAEIPLVQVLVENGCGNDAATVAVRDRLRDAGYQATLAGEADRSDYANTQVIDHDRLRGAGALVLQTLGLTGPPQIQPDPQADASVEVIVGHDLASAAMASR